jgi:sulfate adenylyltransferase subunit 1
MSPTATSPPGRRKYIIADAPGHEQYTRNMVTAASTANLAIILDRRAQGHPDPNPPPLLTRLAWSAFRTFSSPVNKMDLAGLLDQETYERIKGEYLDLRGPGWYRRTCASSRISALATAT